ncbi:beta-lactamase [Streptococcus pyogenes]|nr:beta-lactamase [Streptococcus pyogenes]
MRKLLAAMLMTFFLTPLPVISTEKKLIFSKNAVYQLKQDVVQSTQFYNQLPSNPNLYQETCAYKDSDLTLPAGRLGVNQPLLIKSLVLNKESLPGF